MDYSHAVVICQIDGESWNWLTPLITEGCNGERVGLAGPIPPSAALEPGLEGMISADGGNLIVVAAEELVEVTLFIDEVQVDFHKVAHFFEADLGRIGAFDRG